MTSYREMPDLDLVDLLKADDHFAYQEIYNRYWKSLYNAAFHACRHRENSLDICQGIFEWLWEHRAALVIKSSLAGYLFISVKYKVANLIQRNKIRETLYDDLSVLDIRGQEDSELEVKELKNYIAQLVDELPTKCREIYQLSREEELSHKEIASRLGLAEKTVNEQIYRALKKLKAPLGKLAGLVVLLFYY